MQRVNTIYKEYLITDNIRGDFAMSVRRVDSEEQISSHAKRECEVSAVAFTFWLTLNWRDDSFKAVKLW